MMIKRRKRQRAGIRTQPQIRCDAHLKWVRGHVCAARNMVERDHGCEGDMQAAHVRSGTDGALSRKPGDNWTIPLCAKHHARQHEKGEESFEHRYSIDMKALAAQLWQRSPHRRKFERSLATESPQNGSLQKVTVEDVKA